MKAEKVLQLIALYRGKFEELGINRADYPHDEVLDSAENGLAHCHSMLDKMEGFTNEGRMDKVCRWLSFLQGFLWSQGIYTLTNLMNHNREDI